MIRLSLARNDSVGETRPIRPAPPTEPNSRKGRQARQAHQGPPGSNSNFMPLTPRARWLGSFRNPTKSDPGKSLGK
jgi:hypothetical protein